MQREQFHARLRSGGRSPSAAERCVAAVAGFEEWLGRDAADAVSAEIVAYVEYLGKRAKGALWALRYFYEFVGNEALTELTRDLRSGLIEGAPFPLSRIEGLSPKLVVRLGNAGIRNIDQLLTAAGDPAGRLRLAARTDIDSGDLEDLFELARMMQIRGVKDVRGRLYRGCVGTVEAIAEMSQDQLIEAATTYIANTGFAGVPPTPKEAAFTIAEARRLTSYSS